MATPKLNPTFIDKNKLDESLVNDSSLTKTDEPLKKTNEQLAMESMFAENAELRQTLDTFRNASKTVEDNYEKEIKSLNLQLSAAKSNINPVLDSEIASKRWAFLNSLLQGAAAAGQLYGPAINQQALDKVLTHYIGVSEIVVERCIKRWA